MSDTERLQVGRSVDVSLRDRIAAVIQENLVWEAPNMSARLADAVIAEMQPELNRHSTCCVCNDCWRSKTWEADDE